ncbi:MAG TPA: hypothetical protein VMM60_13290 [Ilumatobacter sp.]|nr:hypothetical protein [Ilumatobacter sp.]
MTRHPFTRVAVAVLALVGTMAACGDENSDAVDAPATTAASTTSPSAPSTTSPPTTAPPVATSVAAATTVVSAPSTAATTVPPTVPPITAPATTAAPTTVPTAAPTSGVAVVYSGGSGDFPWSPIGVWTGTEWTNASWDGDGMPLDVPASASLSGTTIGLSESIAGLSFGPLDYFCVGDNFAPRISIPTGAAPAATDVIAVTSDWNIQPRPALPSTLEPGVFAEAAQALVDLTQAPDPAGVVREVIDVDIDGDGTLEALYVYERQSEDLDGFGNQGDFTLLVAVYTGPDGVTRHHLLFELHEDPANQPGNVEAGFSAVADLNGDGVMEVVTWWTYWESSVIEIYSLDDGELLAVTGGGCSL